MEQRGWLGATGMRDGSEGGSGHRLCHGELLKTNIIVHLQKGWNWVDAAKVEANVGEPLVEAPDDVEDEVRSLMCSLRLRRSSAIYM